uniref:Uncharacterized protein n=1 Tax=viral metagenome TaxID=1070528 RepID=A0A6M3LKE2_9ZZZZ
MTELEQIRKTLGLVEEAINDWKKGKLNGYSTLVVLSLLLNKQDPDEECIRWATEVFRKCIT